FISAVGVLHGLSADGFLHVHWSIQTISDQVYMLLDVTVIAVATVLAACFYGYRTSGGPSEVGASVARSLVVNLMLVHIIVAFFLMAIYGSDAHLPIGG